MEKQETTAIVPVDRYIDTPTFKKELERALPNRAIQAGLLTPERVVRLAITQIRGSAALARCTPISIMACVVEAAQLGLELERVLGHAYLVPFKGEATLIVGYRGFAHLIFNSGTVSSLSAEVVRPGDKFQRMLGTERHLNHVPAPIPKNDGPENWLGAYAAVKFIHGGTDFEYLEKVKIEAARNRSRSWQSFKNDGKSSPWNTDPEEMWRKTAIRRLAKRMPTSTTDKRAEMLQRATILDEYADRKGLLVPTLHGFEVNDNPPEPDPELEPTREVIDVEPEPKSKESFTKGKENLRPPKAKIPPAPPVAEDPVITTKEQTDIYSAAAAVGWRIPDEVLAFLKKKYNLTSMKAVRRSQLPEIMRQIKAGT
jgi:recombination protein RecT